MKDKMQREKLYKMHIKLYYKCIIFVFKINKILSDEFYIIRIRSTFIESRIYCFLSTFLLPNIIEQKKTDYTTRHNVKSSIIYNEQFILYVNLLLSK
jgi:hypothetical protein